jgi:enterochelin esterase-like enzyme
LFRELGAFFSLLLCLAVAGCQSTGGDELPTRAPTAVLPSVPASMTGEPTVSVPATYTQRAAAAAPEAGRPTRLPAIQTATAAVLRGTDTPAASPTWEPLPSPGIGSTDAVVLERPPERVPCPGPGLVFRSSFPGLRGGLGSYHAYLPPCYSRSDRAYPVIYLIHGSVQSDSHWLDLGLAQIANLAIASGRYPPFIAIMPFSDRLGNISSGGDNSVEGVITNYLIPYVDEHFCTWRSPSGRSIGGISRGGYWALEITFRHEDLFGAVSGHSSHLRFETDPPRYNPLATYALADLSRMRIWLDRGEKDFLRVGQDQLSRLLTGAGIDHIYRVYPGGHNDAYWNAHLGEYLDWHVAGWPRERAAYPPCQP